MPSGIARSASAFFVLVVGGCVAPSTGDDASELIRAHTSDGPDGVALLQTRHGTEELAWTEVDGYAIVEGDIIIGLASEMVEGWRSAPTTDIHTRWPEGVVPYVVADFVIDPSRIDQAIAHWEANTSLRFVSRTDHDDYVEFVNGVGCSSYVGMQGGKQTVTVAPGCSAGNVIHEIGHAVGLWHEHTRPDRDDYVLVFEDCIETGFAHNYDKLTTAAMAHGAYDLGSIMHYGSDFFLDRGNTWAGGACEATMTEVDGLWISPQRDVLSAGDIDAIEDIYGGGTSPLQLEMVDEPVAGGTATIRVFGLADGERTVVAAGSGGLGAGACFDSLGNLCLDLAGDPERLAAGYADSNGVATVAYSVPADYDATTFAVQAVAVRGMASVKSDAVTWEIAALEAASCASPNQLRDCNGSCYPTTWLGDGYCDDGALYVWGMPHFDCASYSFDQGDC